MKANTRIRNSGQALAGNKEHKTFTEGRTFVLHLSVVICLIMAVYMRIRLRPRFVPDSHPDFSQKKPPSGGFAT